MDSRITLKQQQVNNTLVNSRERQDTILTDVHNYSQFDKSFQHATTCDSGKCIPVLVQEVYPGDTYYIDISAAIRLSAPANTPFMNINWDLNTFFVPYDQIDLEFKQFMGENPDYGYTDTELEVPTLTIDTEASKFQYTENDLASYLGVPMYTDLKGEKLNIYPFLVYGKIINEYYRNQNYQSSIDVSSVFKTRELKASAYAPVSANNYLTSIIFGKDLAPASKLPDYFMSTLPYQQKGEPILLTGFDLKDLYVTNTEAGDTLNLFSPHWYEANGSTVTGDHSIATSGAFPQSTIKSSGYQGTQQGKVNLSLAIKAVGNPSPFDISKFRGSVVYQHYLETLALNGSRYVEQLQSIWGIQINPKEIRRAEWVHAHNDSLIFNNVQQTSQSTTESQLGNIASNLYNMVNDSNTIEFSASQHGLLMTILTLRTPINNGGQGLPKMFSYRDRLDFFNPLFNGISEQPVKNKELYYNGTNKELNEKTLGFNEPFLNTKYNIDSASGFFSLRSKTSLFPLFLFGEKYSDTPIFNSEFIKFKPETIGNTLFTTADNNVEFYHQFIALFNFGITYVTQQPLYNSPKVYGI